MIALFDGVDQIQFKELLGESVDISLTRIFFKFITYDRVHASS